MIARDRPLVDSQSGSRRESPGLNHATISGEPPRTEALRAGGALVDLKTSLNWELTPVVSIIDSDPLVQSTVRDSARALNADCREYPSGEEFVAGLDPSQPGCVVLESRIPDLSGLEIQQYLTTRAPELPVIFVAGKITVSVAVRAMRAGAIHVLEKPLREAELWETLREAIQLNQLRRAREQERRRADELIAQLTAREIQVIKGVTSGLPNAAIAKRLRVSQRTVELRRSKAMQKLRVNTLAELIHLFTVAGDGKGCYAHPA